MPREEPARPEAVALRALRELTPSEAELVASCARSLDVIRLGDPPALVAMAEALRQLVAGDAFATYAPERASTGWRVSSLLWHGAGSDFDHVGALEEIMSRNPGGWQPGYNPDRPARAQRNRVLRPLARLEREIMLRTPLFQLVHVPTRTQHFDQLRVLICDGPALLAWVGGFREEPFTLRERRRLSALVPALHRRLRVERRLRDADFYHAGLEAALEAIAAPAFIVRNNGSVAHANANGRAAYDADRALTARRADFEATPLAVPGAPDAVLLVKSAPSDDLCARVANAARRWKLTHRQAEVLALMARGDANKLIAAKLGCSLRTVEIHVTGVLRKAGCETRTEVVARLLVRR